MAKEAQKKLCKTQADYLTVLLAKKKGNEK
jgi:hypothetical protein